MFDRILAIVDVIFLILIWQDGRQMLRSALNTEKWEEKTHRLYEEWFAERRAEREARKESARKAREAKAAKAEVKNDG